MVTGDAGNLYGCYPNFPITSISLDSKVSFTAGDLPSCLSSFAVVWFDGSRVKVLPERHNKLNGNFNIQGYTWGSDQIKWKKVEFIELSRVSGIVKTLSSCSCVLMRVKPENGISFKSRHDQYL